MQQLQTTHSLSPPPFRRRGPPQAGGGGTRLDHPGADLTPTPLHAVEGGAICSLLPRAGEGLGMRDGATPPQERRGKTLNLPMRILLLSTGRPPRRFAPPLLKRGGEKLLLAVAFAFPASASARHATDAKGPPAHP